MTITAEEVIQEARTWIGTPFVHGARVKGVGVDCVGLLQALARDFGIPTVDRAAYPMRPDGTLRGEIESRMARVREARPGDVLLMSFGGAEPHHVALYTGDTIIHAHMKARKCIEQPISAYWWSVTRGIYRHKGFME